MTSILADSYIATGAAIGFNRGMSPERQAERSEAYFRKEAMDQELRTRRATEPTESDRKTMADTQSLELQNALETQKTMMLDNNKMTTFRAYERYDVDGDVRHINTMLTELAPKSKLFGNIIRVDKLTEDDRQMMEDMGIPPALATEIINNPELNKSYVRYTHKDGSKQFGDLDALKGMTGYTKDYANVREVKRQEVSRTIEQMEILGFPPTKLSTEAFKLAKSELAAIIGTREVNTDSPEFLEVFNKHYQRLSKDVTNRGYRRENETEVEQAAANRTRLEGFNESDPEWTETYERYKSAIWAERRETSASRNVGSASTAENELLEMGFMDMDIPDLTQTERVKIEQKIRTVEELGGAKLDITTKKNLTDIRKLTSLGRLGSELTDEQTGIIDNVYRLVRRYVSDNVEGVQATAAYSHFRNLAMNALYGGQLTPNEAKQFRKAFGSLAQQRGPVLTQFRVALQDTKDSYEAILATENDMVIKWRTGQTGDDLYDVINALDDRIQMLDDIANDRPITTVNPPLSTNAPIEAVTPETKAIMDRITGKNKGGGQ